MANEASVTFGDYRAASHILSDFEDVDDEDSPRTVLPIGREDEANTVLLAFGSDRKRYLGQRQPHESEARYVEWGSPPVVDALTLRYELDRYVETATSNLPSLIYGSFAHARKPLFAVYVEGNRSSVTAEPPTKTPNDLKFTLIRFLLRRAMRGDAAQIVDRLSELDRMIREEEAGHAGISKDSMRSFGDFLLHNPKLRRPLLALTPDGEIYATWKGNLNEVFSVRFKRDECAFVVIAPNVKHSISLTRLSGTTTVDVLFETVSPHGVARWALHEG